MEKRLRPLLIGRVFHVTNAMAFSSMLLEGAIKPNKTGIFTFSYGQSANSFFRKKDAFQSAIFTTFQMLKCAKVS